MIRFIPNRGKVAIQEDEFATQTESGLYYQQKRNTKYTTGIVMSIGLPCIDNKGMELPVFYAEGDRVLIEVGSWHYVDKYMIVDQDKVTAIVPKDAKIG